MVGKGTGGDGKVEMRNEGTGRGVEKIGRGVEMARGVEIKRGVKIGIGVEIGRERGRKRGGD